MKIRTGFVSNSSSSSFLIYGVCKEEEELKTLWSGTLDNAEDEIDDMYEFLDKKLKGTCLTFSHPEYSGFYIGVSWDRVEDNETGAQFKKRIENALKSIGIEDACETYEEAWHD